MCQKATIAGTVALLGLVLCALAPNILAQDIRQDDARTSPRPFDLEWRHVGNAALDLGLPSVATGPVARVWYAPDGSRLLALTASGRVFETSDFEQWRAAQDAWPAGDIAVSAPQIPEANARLKAQFLRPGRLYAFAGQIHRSDDGGVTWSGLTQYRGSSILGAPVTDLAVSPSNPDELTAANAYGVWHSLDAGLSWTGLNQFLPNLSVRRLVATPSNVHGLLAAPSRDDASLVEWAPGEKNAWRPAQPPQTLAAQRWEYEFALRGALSQKLGARITAVASTGDYRYAGAADGRLWASSDAGRTWRQGGNPEDSGAVESIFVDSREPRIALAALGARLPSAGLRTAHVRRTQNGGVFWDDITANLPDGAARGITADITSGAVYAATDSGVFVTFTDLRAAGPPTSWSPLAGLPATAANDIRLDANSNQIWVALDGYGVYWAIAPHRFRNPNVVNAADFSSLPAAPGSLLSVLGAKVIEARMSGSTVPVFSATDSSSQLQVPFAASGPSLPLTFQSGDRRFQQNVPLRPVSPAIFIDPDGSPFVMDAASGLMLDATQPARSGSTIQILATGLGRVKPDWPTGVPAPQQDPPKVTAPVRVYLDHQPLKVSQSVLAPGYIGFYLIEVEIPRIVNSGPAELYVEADGQSSNRVRIYIQP